jgi:hypothetical protein
MQCRSRTHPGGGRPGGSEGGAATSVAGVAHCMRSTHTLSTESIDVVGTAVRAIEGGAAFCGYSPFLMVLIEQRQVRLPLIPDHLPAREAADGDDHSARFSSTG